MSVGSWRVSVRIAARTARRAKGRTLLIAAMVGLPVMGMAAADTLFWTYHLSPAQEVERQVGAADFVVSTDRSGTELYDGLSYGDAITPQAKAHRGADIDAVVATGAEVTPFGLATVRYDFPPFGEQTGELEVVDLESPLLRGHLSTVDGRAPRTATEAALSTGMLTDLGLELGDTVTFERRPPVTVVGAVQVMANPGVHAVFADEGSVLLPARYDLRRWLVGESDGTSDEQLVASFEASGLGYRSLEELVAAADRDQEVVSDPAAVGTGVLVGGLAALQIVLLAGAAFAVGARRQQHDLGLVAAQGGDRRHVRSVVLASGLVIGLVTSVVAAAAGVLLAALARDPIDDRTWEMFGPFDVAALDLAVIVAIGTVTAVLAAAVPARTASRMPVLAALSGRRGTTGVPRAITVTGLAGLALGFLIALAGTKPPANYNLILVGAIVAELGLVLCAATLVGLAGLAARWFPLSLRLALRDSARHRGRSAPAVAAVMAALTATVGLATFVVSDDAHNRSLYEPNSPVELILHDGKEAVEDPADWSEIAQVVTDAVPGTTPYPVRTVHRFGPNGQTDVVVRRPFVDRMYGGTGEWWGSVAVGDVAFVEAITGRDAGPEVTAALRAGHAVALGFGPTDRLRLRYVNYIRGVNPRIKLPAVHVGGTQKYYSLPGAVISPATAERLGLQARTTSVVWALDHAPSRDELDKATAALQAGGHSGGVAAESGYHSDIGLMLLALIGVSVVVTLVATAIATGLAAADARPDLATLAAVGASPRVRRTLSAAQASSIAGLGALLGVVAGLVPAYAVIQARDDFPFVVPWGVLAATVLVLPGVAAALAALLTRSRLPMSRRLV